MGSGDNGGMTQTTDDNRPTSPAPRRSDVADVATGQIGTAHVDPAPVGTAHVETAHVDTGRIDPLDEIDATLDGLDDLDPAEAVAVLSDITAELNKELDADTDRS